MHKYSVEVSHYIVTYYKDTKKNPDTGKTEIERKQSHTPLTDLNWTKDFDNFIEENRWVDSEIVDILDKVWKALPGKHVYLSKSTSNAILDIKLSNHGFPKTIYRVIYKHHRNDVEDKKLEAYPCPFPVSDEERALLDRLKKLRKECKDEIHVLNQNGKLSIRDSRRILAYFSGITSSISYLLYANDNGRSWDSINKTHDELQTLLKDIEVEPSDVLKDTKIPEIVDNMYTLIWDVNELNTRTRKTVPAFASRAIRTINYWVDYLRYKLDPLAE